MGNSCVLRFRWLAGGVAALDFRGRVGIRVLEEAKKECEMKKTPKPRAPKKKDAEASRSSDRVKVLPKVNYKEMENLALEVAEKAPKAKKQLAMKAKKKEERELPPGCRKATKIRKGTFRVGAKYTVFYDKEGKWYQSLPALLRALGMD